MWAGFPRDITPSLWTMYKIFALRSLDSFCLCPLITILQVFGDHRLGVPTEDYVNKDGIFGPIKATSLNTKPISATIAEPYTWFANEAFWSEECKRTFGAPEEGDDDDPACDGKPCIEPPHK